MFTVLFALLAIVVFALTLIFTKFNFKKASINALITVCVGFACDIIIGTYFISLSHMINY